MKFQIIQKDPLEYKQQILQFWEKYLPETPSGRFEWMGNNPSGPAIWFFAIDDKTGELSGTISVMPKDLFIHGHTLKTGIMGDLMIADKYRVFGPALQLLKAVIENSSRLGLDLIYTIPNTSSKKLIQRAGFKKALDLRTYVRPIASYYYLKGYLPNFVAAFTAPIIDISLRLLSREKYHLDEASFKNVNEASSSFDNLWENIKGLNSSPGSIFSSAFISWRFLQNPVYVFRVITYQPNSNKIEGYISLATVVNKTTIHDMRFLTQEDFKLLLTKAIKIARKENLRSIYFTVPDNEHWHRKLKSFGFFDAKSKMELYSWSPKNVSLRDWVFFEVDRNI